MGFFIFIPFLIEHSVRKQWRHWSDATECGLCPNKRTLDLYGLKCMLKLKQIFDTLDLDEREFFSISR